MRGFCAMILLPFALVVWFLGYAARLLRDGAIAGWEEGNVYKHD